MELDRIKAKKPALGKPLTAGAEKGVSWAAPRLVCEIEFRDWTHDGLIRQASFKGLREDKLPEDISLEAPRRSKSRTATDIAAVGLTHPERILWAEPGITKQGLADFYAAIAEWILPPVTGWILSLLRCPSGTGAKCFFAKHPWPGLSDVVQPVGAGEKQPMLAIDGFAELMSFVQAGVVEIHPWGCRANHLEQPDRLIFDLDPGEDAPWHAVIEAAKELRDRLETCSLKGFVKTSGSKGLHVVVPVEPLAGWDQAKSFTASVAQAMARDRPDRYAATVAKRVRRGRIFIDTLRNDRGATAVAAYSTRALPRASVSTPLAWGELSEGLRSDHFTVGNLRHRLEFLKRDPWQSFFKIRQRIPVDPR